MPGMERSETRAELIRVGGALIARQGYNNTGINAVLTEAGVPKGSFYYYFANKEDFGLAVIEGLDVEHAARLDSVLGDELTPPLQRIRNYFDAGLADMVEHDYCRGCPIGNLGQELAGQNETFRSRLDAVFSGWKQRFVTCLEAAREAGEIAADSDVEALAEFLLAGWEGATLRAKVTRSTEPMAAFAQTFLDRVLRST